ncbi:MAG: cell division protein, partial [Methanomicrobiales archaeon]|nr:cell division protein [Methanomicrobiales archaeon]
MRVLAIGLGGAGSRIVDHLYDHDCRSRICCMKALAVDLDPNSLQQLRYLPSECRMFFPPIDPHHPYDIEHVIHIDEVMTRIQHIDTIQIDAILICCGLGGEMVQTAPRIIHDLRKSFIEPVFVVATIPSRNEGMKRSAKAFEDLEMLREKVDALILFDNELLMQKVVMAADEKAAPPPEPVFLREIRKILPENPRDTYFLMNDRIARNIGLLLRAGEFNERGLEVAEVVLDAGEVLKTLTHMGIISVGYAVDELEPQSWFSRFRPRKPTIESTHTKAARIVSLAKRAVYEESSISCDLTSAQKALVLIAGPSHELSMRGFQTVRKWIDRSISGLEMRSGDYPVKNTRYIGIIIVLAGLTNVPRIEELRSMYEKSLEENSVATVLPEAAVPSRESPAAPAVTEKSVVDSSAPSPESVPTIPVSGTEPPVMETQKAAETAGPGPEPLVDVSAHKPKRSSRKKDTEEELTPTPK